MKRLLLLAAMAYGVCQAAPSFEVASITPCKPGTPEPAMEHTGMTQFTFPGGRFKADATTLKVLLEWAYRLQPAQHAGGPSWIETDRYDVVAKAEGPATDEQMRQMMQTLLAERFQLKVHHEDRKLGVYVIAVGKGQPKLFPPKESEVYGLRFAPKMGPDNKVASYHVIGTRFTVAQLADTFGRQLGRAVIDKTGLEGEFDFTIDITPDESRPNPMDPATLMGAMREQLGLALTSQTIPVDVLVIDNAEKVKKGD